MTVSPAAPAPTAAPDPPADPFRFGWRYIRRQLPSGELVFEPQPLTLDDVHHPQQGLRTIRFAVFVGGAGENEEQILVAPCCTLPADV